MEIANNMIKLTTTQINPSTNELLIPLKATKNAAAYDLYCPEVIKIWPGQVLKLNLLTKLIIPKGIVCVISPRSSCSPNLGLTNTIGIVDSDYHQPLFAKIFHRNVTYDPLEIKQGERFLQMMFLKLANEEVHFLPENEFKEEVTKAETYGDRDGGDGSTGKF